MHMDIRFPNLGITLSHVGKTLTVFGFDIAYYGIVIGAGMLAGLMLAQWQAGKTGQNKEDYLDFIIYAILFSIAGARLYYVAFSWDQYKDDLLSIFNLRLGGLAIYGGVIAAVLTLIVFTKKRRLSFFLMADTGCLGLLAGQIIGRFGNFFNREAFGGYTDNLLAMQLPVDAVRSGEISGSLLSHQVIIDGTAYIQVHPTFLYEALWNLGILLFLLWYRKRKKFDGELFAIYLAGYGIGRFWIESLRTDQLLLPGTEIPVSMVLAAMMAAGAIVFLLCRRKNTTSTAKEVKS